MTAPGMIAMNRFVMFFGVALFATDAEAQVLKQEPPMGALKEGQVVLVDDGQCPKGQIRRVVGGNHVDAGGTRRIRRSSSCVARH